MQQLIYPREPAGTPKGKASAATWVLWNSRRTSVSWDRDMAPATALAARGEIEGIRPHLGKCDEMEALGGVEPPTNGLGNRCSIHLSYGADADSPPLSHDELGDKPLARCIFGCGDPSLRLKSSFAQDDIALMIQMDQGFGARSSRARLSSRTLTRGSPSSPRSR